MDKTPYFTLILADNYFHSDRFDLVGKIVKVVPGDEIHWIKYVVGDESIPGVSVDLGYYTHKPMNSNLFKLVENV